MTKIEMPKPPDEDRYFRVDHLREDLAGRSIRGGAITMLNQSGKFLLTLGSTAVLARILTPVDFGLLAMVVSIVGFLMMFRDLGLSMATVQRAEINHQQVSTLFWVNVLIGSIITVLTVAIAPMVGWFYKEPRLVPITLAFSGAFLLSGLSVQHQALLRRQMRFNVIAIVEIISLGLSIVAAILSAVSGLGYWSLVIMHLVREGFYSAGMWLACGWKPGRPARRVGVRSLLVFGGYLTGFNLINFFIRNMDNVIIGRFVGAQALGLYAKAYQLLLLPVRQINLPLSSVAVPTLSRLQDAPNRFRAYYQRGVMLTVTAGMPAVVFLFVTAEKAVLAILGPQWLDAVVLFRVLAPAAFVGTFNMATSWVFVSLARTARQLRWGVFSALLSVLGFAIGVHWGAIGVAAAVSLVICGLRLPGLIYCFKRTPLRLSDLAIALWRPAVCSVLAGCALYLIERFVLPGGRTGPGPALSSGAEAGLRILVDFGIYVLLYIGIWFSTPGGRRSMRDILNLARQLRPVRQEGM
jgi:O-antigen/teichoic acid export membrane protein